MLGPAPHNGTLEAGQTIEFGFQANLSEEHPRLGGNAGLAADPRRRLGNRETLIYSKGFRLAGVTGFEPG